MQLKLFTSTTVQIVIYPEKDVHVDANDTVKFSCVAYGSPIPHFIWSRNGSVFSNNSRVTIREDVVSLRGITFMKSIVEMCHTEEADSGEIRCTADNGMRSDSVQFSLSVLPKGRVGLLPFLTHH